MTDNSKPLCPTCQFLTTHYLTAYDGRGTFLASVCEVDPVNQKLIDPQALRVCREYKECGVTA